jgi:hypothetical protein
VSSRGYFLPVLCSFHVHIIVSSGRNFRLAIDIVQNVAMFSKSMLPVIVKRRKSLNATENAAFNLADFVPSMTKRFHVLCHSFIVLSRNPMALSTTWIMVFMNMNEHTKQIFGFMFAIEAFVFLCSFFFGYMWRWNYTFAVIFLAMFPKLHWVICGTFTFSTHIDVVQCGMVQG